jgi:alanine dehydrogenase
MLPLFDAAQVRAATPWAALVEALREAFRAGCVLPPRHHHGFEVPGEREATLLLMPAWREGATLGVKIVNIVPGNDARGLPAVSGVYLLFSATTGQPLALIDGAELTARRTAAASGRGRNQPKAEALAGRLRDELGLNVTATAELEPAVRAADLVSCGTTSVEPLVHGAWLAEGAHLDLVGGFTPAMREADDEAVRRARVWVDTADGGTREGGDIVQPLASGVLARDAIVGDLFGLCRGEVTGRATAGEITLFKSVGTALEDLAAATLVVQQQP